MTKMTPDRMFGNLTRRPRPVYPETDTVMLRGDEPTLMNVCGELCARNIYHSGQIYYIRLMLNKKTDKYQIFCKRVNFERQRRQDRASGQLCINDEGMLDYPGNLNNTYRIDLKSIELTGWHKQGPREGGGGLLTFYKHFKRTEAGLHVQNLASSGKYKVTIPMTAETVKRAELETFVNKL